MINKRVVIITSIILVLAAGLVACTSGSEAGPKSPSTDTPAPATVLVEQQTATAASITSGQPASTLDPGATEPPSNASASATPPPTRLTNVTQSTASATTGAGQPTSGAATAQPTTAGATQPAAISAPAQAGGTSGYLWWLNDPSQFVFVIGPSHQQVAASPDEANQWAAAGTACYAEGGSAYARDASVPAPANAAGIQVKSGRCAGFKGWVLVGALHANKP